MSAQAEAYIRKKPRRIIQSQALIVFLMCLVVVGAIPAGSVVFWFIFGLCPVVIIPCAVCLWVFGVLAYVSLRVYVAVRERQG